MSVRHTDGRFEGEQAVQLYWQAWLPGGDARAVLVVAHGSAEHGGRYAEVAERLAEEGIVTYVMDQRGHGKSEGQRANVGRMSYVVADLGRMAKLARERHSRTPLFVLGHSLGSVIALEYAVANGNDLRGLILSGAGLDISVVSEGQYRVAQLLSKLAPNLGLLKLDSSAVSRDPEVVRAYDDDPLVYSGKLPVRTLAEGVASSRRLHGELDRLRMPLLLIHGGADSLIAPNGSQVVYDRASSEDKTLKIYDGMYHETLNDPDRDQVIGDLVSWIVERAA